MCEANVYLIDEKGDEKLIFEAVYSISDFLGGLCLENIYQKRKYIKARIKEIELLSHRIYLEKID